MLISALFLVVAAIAAPFVRNLPPHLLVGALWLAAFYLHVIRAIALGVGFDKPAMFAAGIAGTAGVIFGRLVAKSLRRLGKR